MSGSPLPTGPYDEAQFLLSLDLQSALEAAARRHYVVTWATVHGPQRVAERKWGNGLVPEETRQYHLAHVTPQVYAAAVPTAAAILPWIVEQLALQLETRFGATTGAEVAALLRGVGKAWTEEARP